MPMERVSVARNQTELNLNQMNNQVIILPIVLNFGRCLFLPPAQ
jgi:hypothetical protein